MKTWTIGKKIITGFAGLLILAILLGGMAVWKMAGVKAVATTLASDFMPASAVANNIEREALQTMYEMRGYAFTGDTNFLGRSLANLADVKQHLQAAKDLVAKAGDQDLDYLKEATTKAEAKALEYEQLARQTVAVTENLEKDREAMDAAARSYMKVCSTYLENQNAKLQETLTGTNAAAGVDVAAVQDRVQKINVANDIIGIGNAIRVGNFKAQAARDPHLFRETQKKFEELYPKLDALKAITKQEVNLKQIEKCRAAGTAYAEAMTSFLGNWLAREELGKQRGAVGDAVLTEAKNTAIKSMDASSADASLAVASLTTASTTMIVGLSIAALFGITLALVITSGINKVLKGITASLAEGSDQVASAASQVSATSQSLAEGASEQAASLEETSSSLEEISSMTQRNAQNVQSAKDFTAQTRATAESGAQSTHEMGQAMQGIRTASGEMRDAMNGIKAASNDVGKIIKTIDEIAFQTNILALNAAVEAARAGEAGMGFAVVADEVRNLAQRSAKAAKETADMIETSIKRSDDGVRVTDKVVSSVEEVAAKSQQLEQKLAEIVAKAQKVDEQVAQIASASNEQSQGIGEVNMAVSQMDKVTQSNASNAEESAAAAEELNAQAEVLKDAVRELQQLVSGTTSAPTAQPKAAPTQPAFRPKPNSFQSRPKPAAPSRPAAPAPKNLDFPMPEPIGAGTAKSGFKDF